MKNLEKINSSDVIGDILNSIEDYDFKYPSSIRKIIKLKVSESFFIGKPTERIEKNLRNIENYFNILNSILTIDDGSISFIGVELFKKNIMIRNSIFQDSNKHSKLIIESVIGKINYDGISEKIKEKVLCYPTKLSDEEICFRNNNDLYYYIIQLIDCYDFLYPDLMKRFLSQLNFDSLINIKIIKSKDNGLFSEKRALVVLGNLSNLITAAKVLISKVPITDDQFILDFIMIEYFTPYNLKQFFTSSFKSNKYEIKTIGNYYNSLSYNFALGLGRLRNFYHIKADNYCNIESNLNIDVNTLAKILSELSKESIMLIYNIRKLKFNQIKENNKFIEKLEKLGKEFLNNKNIQVQKQTPIAENKEIVESIIRNLHSYRQIYKDFTIDEMKGSYNDCGIRIVFAIFKIKYKQKKFLVRIEQIDLHLYYRIYLTPDISFREYLKEQIFRMEDFERLFFIIKQYVGENSDGK